MKNSTSTVAEHKNEIQQRVFMLTYSKPRTRGRQERTILYSLMLLLLFFSPLFWRGTTGELLAQDGALDTTFNTTDIGFGYGDGANSYVSTTSLQLDGKIIIGGDFTSYNGTARNRIARLNVDGTIDTSFNPGTGANYLVRTTSLQSDGKIIIGGNFTSYNGTARNRIARLNADGTLDTSFNPGSGANDFINTVTLQTDGKIIIGGAFFGFNGTGRTRIARLNANGTLDTSFNPGTGADDDVRTISIQSDGKIIIGGEFTSYNGTGRNYLARLNTDGTLDATFNQGIGPDYDVHTSSIQSDGKIIIGGSFNSYNGTSRNGIARLNIGGTLDATFNPGTGANYSVWTISIQSDGKIIIGGTFISYNGIPRNRIARLNAVGTLDTSFNPGIGANDYIYAISLQIDGKIIIGGSFISYNGTPRNRITRLNTDGTLDTTFNPGSGVNNRVWTTSIQSDGKIIIGGEFTSYNGIPRNSIARLNVDGTLDTSFNPGTGTNHFINTTALQSDGKIIIGGYFSSYNGTSSNRIARLNTDGTPDTTFSPGTGANDYVRTISLQSDGKIIIGGEFTGYNGTARNYIARLNADGTLDATFNPGTGADNYIWTTSLQSDGKIIVGGNFIFFNGIFRGRIARLNTDGTVDSSFNPGWGTDSFVYTATLQSNGKIIIGGSFTNYNLANSWSIARLNTDGTLDASFNPGSGAAGTVYTTSNQSDGKIIIGGGFTSYNGISRNYIARLNVDGTLDSTFNPGSGPNYWVRTTSLQSDWKIIIGGEFTAYDGTGRNRIARIISTCSSTLSSVNQSSCGSYTSPSGNYVWTSSGIYSDTLVNALGCDSIVTINLTVLPVPVVMINALGSTSFCIGDSVILSASPSMSTYQWYKRNNPIPGATSIDYVAKFGGRYKCIAQNQALCSDTSNIITVSPPCIPIDPPISRIAQTNKSDTQFLHVFPNPGTGIFQVESSGGQLRVFNSLGILIHSFEMFEGDSIFDISEYPDGIYLLSFLSGKSEYFKKIILIR